MIEATIRDDLVTETLDEIVGKWITSNELRNVTEVHATDCRGVRVDLWPVPEYRDPEMELTSPIRVLVKISNDCWAKIILAITPPLRGILLVAPPGRMRGSVGLLRNKHPGLDLGVIDIQQIGDGCPCLIRLSVSEDFSKYLQSPCRRNYRGPRETQVRL